MKIAITPFSTSSSCFRLLPTWRTMIQAYPYNYLVMRRLTEFGFSETLVSDNGTQFTSADFQEYLQRVGARHMRTAPYHPSSNGLAERFIQRLKAALRKSSRSTSPSDLADFLLAYRNTPQATTAEAPSVLLLGRCLRTRLDLVRPSVEDTVAHKQFREASRHRRRESTFCEGDLVRVRNFRRGPRWFSATVLARTGPVSYRVSVVTPRGVSESVRHRNHIVRAPDRRLGDYRLSLSRRGPRDSEHKPYQHDQTGTAAIGC
ncbi:uncharacterized protein K02A2.6-like [Rhipicephalus sanguineus]|uniref:uncharacterized protein K02A2.6-like n=1 Tax=Rhipicephalus sanguineus TaxID=34632 RepID=UPI0020C301AB|nr:uncharacterized protein K02A2.6-like [Rhipicephalus sanguineus]